MDTAGTRCRPPVLTLASPVYESRRPGTARTPAVTVALPEGTSLVCWMSMDMKAKRTLAVYAIPADDG